MNDTGGNDKFYAEQVGIMKLPSGYCDLAGNNLDELWREIETNLKLKLNESQGKGSFSIRQSRVGEEIVFPKLKYRFKGNPCLLEVILVTTKNSKKSLLIIKHLFECGSDEFIKKKREVADFFDGRHVLNEEIHKIILNFCIEIGKRKLLHEVGEITLFSGFFLIKSEEDRIRIDKIFDEQDKEGDRLIDEMIKEKNL